MDIRKEIGKNIKKLRIEHSISQEELAYRVGTSSKHLSRLENGSYINLNIGLAYKIAKALKSDFHELFRLK